MAQGVRYAVVPAHKDIPACTTSNLRRRSQRVSSRGFTCCKGRPGARVDHVGPAKDGGAGAVEGRPSTMAWKTECRLSRLTPGAGPRKCLTGIQLKGGVHRERGLIT